MKIMHFLTSINTGGAEKFCVDLCNTEVEISQNDIYLCVLDDIDGDKPLVQIINKNVKLISLNKRGGYSFKIIFKIFNLIKQIKPDCIHLNGRAFIYTSLPIILANIPSVYTVHTLADKEYNKYFRFYIKQLFKYFPKLFMPVGIGDSVLESIQDMYGKQHNTMIYNGSSKLHTTDQLKDVQGFIRSLKNNNKTLVFCSIGRIAPEKNNLLLVEVFNNLLDAGYDIALCIIGYDSTKKKDYQKKCELLNKYPQKIRFLGRKENIADYLSCVDALCMPSYYEGLPITVLESFSMGVPVLSTPCGGAIDIIQNNINGYISKNTTIIDYTLIMKNFIDKPLKNKSGIINIYENNYTMDICAKKYIRLYNDRLQAVK